MSRPLVTVLTPTYNRAAWLPETIESVLSQDYDNVEYLILDDGSSDDTAKVVSQYKEIRYVYQDNKGEPTTVNNGWKMAHGDYFAVVNSDDLVQSKWLSCVVDFMENNPEIIVAYPDWHLIDINSRPIAPVQTFEYSQTDMVSWFHCFPGPGAVIKKSALGSVEYLREGPFRYASDMLMWFRLAKKGPFARVPEFLATWRKHEGSITESGKGLERGRELLKLADTFFSEPDLPPEISALEQIARGRALAVASYLTRDCDPLWSYYFWYKSGQLINWKDPRFPSFIRVLPPDAPHKVLQNTLQRWCSKLNTKNKQAV